MSVLVGTVWPTTWLMGRTDEDDGAGIANVLALPVSGFSLVVGTVSLFVAWRSRLRTDELAVLVPAARDLLRAVVKGEAATLARLLGDTGRARPADVGFVAPEAAEVWWRDDGGSASGSLDDVAVYYRSLELGRLVVLGEPGAGKTVLALRLLLDLAADARATLDHTPTARVRVPVRLSLSSFTLPEQPCTPSVLHERLEAWITGQLSGAYGVQPSIARELVADGWVLPVLDGLDEIDPDHTPPQRAHRVLDALNQPTGDAPASIATGKSGCI
ncbi:hypothetical protein AB0G02_24980 [Actinosynnema sp. NPDC023658]|uniref:hypothetical protein n=1 Tax=Actinosynnema sp. NPDC023658 TaxID=3155465 RepID=UPI0033C0B5F0